MGRGSSPAHRDGSVPGLRLLRGTKEDCVPQATSSRHPAFPVLAHPTAAPRPRPRSGGSRGWPSSIAASGQLAGNPSSRPRLGAAGWRAPAGPAPNELWGFPRTTGARQRGRRGSPARTDTRLPASVGLTAPAGVSGSHAAEISCLQLLQLYSLLHLMCIVEYSFTRHYCSRSFNSW